MTPKGIIVHHSLTQDGIGYCVNKDRYIDIRIAGDSAESMERLVDLTINLIVMYGIAVDDIHPASKGCLDTCFPWDEYIDRVKEVMS